MAAYEALCDLVVREQFKICVPSHIATYINEHKVKTAAEAAHLADKYVLTHMGDRERRARDDIYRVEGSKFRAAGKWEERAGPRSGRPERAARGMTQFDSTKICNYCKDRGHWKVDYPRWGSSGAQGKSAALAASVKRVSPVVSACQQGEVEVKCGLEESDFSAFVSDGCVSLVGSDITAPVKILRDTGAFDSYIVSSVLPFSQETNTGDHVLMRGMGLPVPLH